MSIQKRKSHFLINPILISLASLLFWCCQSQQNQTPNLVASFTYAPASPVAGQSVQFTDTSTGSPTSWQWAFGDSATSSAENPSHTYTTVASYTVTLTVNNNSGSNSASRSISVLPSTTLIASFTYAPINPNAGQSVQFKDTSTGMPTSWQWTFGDGGTSTLQNPSHIYAVSGPYTAALTISAGANSNSTSHTISVRQPNAITAASPSLADVKAAIASATYGDTVVVPAGSATWSSQISLTKGISILGAGAGSTVITQSAGAFGFTPDSTQRSGNYMLRISGFTFAGAGGSVISLTEGSSNTVPTRNIRIDHNTFTASGSYPIYVQGNFWGVIDSNTFSGNLSFEIFGNDTTAAYQAFYPATYGTADNLYFEDNTFTGSSQFFFNSGHGGRYAIRHNTSTATYMGNPLFDQHGNQAGGIMGLMLCEIYENTFTGMTSGVARWDYQRGGKLLFYNNSGTSTGGSPDITVNDDVADPDPVNLIQHPYDDYFWNNTWNGSRVPAIQGVTINYGGNIGVVPTENVQFFNQNDNFDGSAGMGVGPLAARPASCTLIGAGWWATDTQTLFVWDGNEWATHYTPYTYPHPLRN